MSLLDKIEICWTKKAEEQSVQWADKLKANKEDLQKAAKQFHEWRPLHVYLSVTRATKTGISFGLRYQGQEVASLVVNGDVQLVISPKVAKKNSEYFGINAKGTYNWQSLDAAKFREDFKKVTPLKALRFPEHSVESEFLKQMAADTREKFGGTLKHIQPVLLAGCPFQFPLPISGSEGVPKPSKGNIDILARRGTGRGTKISIWELKKPDTTVHAIEQVYIYAVTLIKMLRSQHNDSGRTWYQDIIGFKSDVPDQLIIEGVVAVSLNSRQRDKFNLKLQKFKAENSLSVGNNNSINLYVAYYQEGPPMAVDIQPV